MVIHIFALSISASFPEKSARLPEGWIPFSPVSASAPLLDVAKLLSNAGVKRVPVLDEAGEQAVNLVSQSSVIAELVANAEQCAPMLAQTLEDVGLTQPLPVYSVREDEPVKYAFKLIRDKVSRKRNSEYKLFCCTVFLVFLISGSFDMRLQNVSAVPVLNDEGAMIGNISAEHIFFVSIVGNKMYLLQLPAAKFIEYVSNSSHAWDIKSNAITCRASDTLLSVMQTMSAAKIHRIYLSDDAGRPYRVISQTDLLAKLT